MQRKKVKRTTKNLFFLTIGQIITVIAGLLLPRFFIMNFGSSINGLLSSANQYIVYLTLFEAGLGAVVLQSLYKPVAQNDKQSINAILVSTSKHYKKTALWYFVALVCLSLIYPFVVSKEISYFTAFLAIFLSGAGKILLFYYYGKYKILLQAEGKNYIISNITTTITILVSIGKIIGVYVFKNPIAVLIIAFLIDSLQALIYMILIKSKYKWIDLKVEAKEISGKQRWSNLLHRISAMIFANTDIILLTIFCDLRIVSVYTVYKLVATHLESFINIFSDSYRHSLGQSYNVDKELFLKKFDAFQFAYYTIVFSLLTVTLILYLPFVRIYTHGASDINYVDNLLPIMFVLISILDLIRAPYISVIHFAGHFRETQWRAIAEMLINIAVSIIGVIFLGVYGVLLGTIVALLYRSFDIIIYANRRILKKRPIKTFLVIFLDFLIVFASYFLTSNISNTISSIFELIKYGFVLSSCYFVVFVAINSMFYPNHMIGFHREK